MRWAFNRSDLLRCLDNLKSTVGSKINNICDCVRISIIPKSTTEALVYIYGTNLSNFVCVRYGEILADGIEFELEKESHLLVDHEKLFKICRASNLEKVVIIEIEQARYVNEGGVDKLANGAKYCIKTEAKNTIISRDVFEFPQEEFEGDVIAEYTSGLFPEMWRKASIAKGELDIKRTCLHYNGDMFTVDSTFACIVESLSKLRFPKTYSINLESGIGEIIERMSGNVVVKKNPANNKICFLDESNGIYIACGLAVEQKIPYENALNKPYDSNFRVSKQLFESALKRAAIFINEKDISSVRLNVIKGVDRYILLVIVKPQDNINSFEEEVELESATGELNAMYKLKNLIKAITNNAETHIDFCWRTIDTGRMIDNTARIIDQKTEYRCNAIVPSVVMVTQQNG